MFRIDGIDLVGTPRGSGRIIDIFNPCIGLIISCRASPRL